MTKLNQEKRRPTEADMIERHRNRLINDREKLINDLLEKMGETVTIREDDYDYLGIELVVNGETVLCLHSHLSDCISINDHFHHEIEVALGENNLPVIKCKTCNGFVLINTIDKYSHEDCVYRTNRIELTPELRNIIDTNIKVLKKKQSFLQLKKKLECVESVFVDKLFTMHEGFFPAVVGKVPSTEESDMLDIAIIDYPGIRFDLTETGDKIRVDIKDTVIALVNERTGYAILLVSIDGLFLNDLV